MLLLPHRIKASSSNLMEKVRCIKKREEYHVPRTIHIIALAASMAPFWDGLWCRMVKYQDLHSLIRVTCGPKLRPIRHDLQDLARSKEVSEGCLYVTLTELLTFSKPKSTVMPTHVTVKKKKPGVNRGSYLPLTQCFAGIQYILCNDDILL